MTPAPLSHCTTHIGLVRLVQHSCYVFYFFPDGSDTTSHTNTIELYGPSKETALYPMTPSDGDRSYGTYDKNDDDFSDDYKSYEVSIGQFEVQS